MYFQERCGGGPKFKDFWPAIKPFLLQKSTKQSGEPIILKDPNEKLISDQSKVAEKQNTLYLNIAENIGIKVNIQNDENHPSVQKVQSKLGLDVNFEFRPVTDEDITKCIKKKTRFQNIHRSRSYPTQNNYCWKKIPNSPNYLISQTQ